jgi:HK97 family phage prohead protease
MKNERVALRLYNRDPKIVRNEPPVETSLSSDTSTEQAQSSRVMQGYATLYNVKTDLYWYSLSIDPKAFDESLARPDDVVSLFNHDWNYVLGRLPDTLKIDANHEYGLWQETELPNHALGQQVFEDIQRKALTQMSVSFMIDEYVFTEGKSKDELGNYHVTKASLQDVSAVTFGQYPQTTLEIKKLYAERPEKAFFEQLLSQGMEEKAVKQSLARSVEVQILKNKLRSRMLRGLHGI